MGETKVYDICVDAGCITFLRMDYVKSYGTPRTTKEGVVVTVPKGKQEVTVLVPRCWAGSQVKVKEFDLKEDTEFYLGDSCYIVNDDEWNVFLKDTNYVQNVPSEKGFVVNTGGDGCFEVRYSVREIS